MDPLPTPRPPNTTASTAAVEHDLVEIDAAIALVASGMATRVRLTGLLATDASAAVGQVRAGTAHVGFRLDRPDGGVVDLTVGPRR